MDDEAHFGHTDQIGLSTFRGGKFNMKKEASLRAIKGVDDNKRQVSRTELLK